MGKSWDFYLFVYRRKVKLILQEGQAALLEDFLKRQRSMEWNKVI
ncbi:hypothetical protein Nmel_001276 [Mimus melanotis]